MTTLSVRRAGEVGRSPFRPVSPCLAACIEQRGHRLNRAARAARTAALLGVVGAALIGAVLIGLVPAIVRRRAATRLLRRTARGVLTVLGIESDRRVKLPHERALVVANHISWLDIVALVACDRTTRLRLVAKSEVRNWPVIGRLATIAGTIFVDRSRPRTLPATLTEVRAALVDGDVVVVFVEGTTCCGTHQAPYRPAMFQAALDAEARVVPLTIRYCSDDTTIDTTAAFLGDETLATSIRRVIAVPRSRIRLRIGPTLYPQPGADRRRLARAAQQSAAREVRHAPAGSAPVGSAPRGATAATS